MKSAACSGGAGDIIYSIPVMRRLGVTIYYIKRNFYLPPHSNLYETIAPLLRSQGFTCLPTSGEYPWQEFDPTLQYDYNIDNFRFMPLRNRIHIMRNMAMCFKVSARGIQQPWLNISAIAAPDNLIHLTSRWRENSKVNWMDILGKITGSLGFIGFKQEHKEFTQQYGKIKHFPTENLLEMAQLIAGCKRVYCNQSVALTIAQGLGKEYHLERKPTKTNTLLFTQNEYLL